MSKKLVLTIPRLRVLSALFTNLSAAWFLASFATDQSYVLTTNLVFGTISLMASFMAESAIEKYV